MGWNIFADIAEAEAVIVAVKAETATLKATMAKLAPFVQAVSVLLPPADAIIANALVAELNTLVSEIPDATPVVQVVPAK